jgi:hypothetical protein
MRDLPSLEMRDERAAEAVELFCTQSKKLIGVFSTAGPAA